jgi:hypothetical protein
LPKGGKARFLLRQPGLEFGQRRVRRFLVGFQLSLGLKVLKLQVAEPAFLRLPGAQRNFPQPCGAGALHSGAATFVEGREALLLTVSRGVGIRNASGEPRFRLVAGFPKSPIGRMAAGGEVVGELLFALRKGRGRLLQTREEREAPAETQIGGVIHNRF